MPSSDSEICGLPTRSELEPRLRLDCRHYRGERPCAADVPGVCPADCRLHAPMGRRVLIIKLAALGDVIRTAAILPVLKGVWPQSHITWVTRPNGVRMLANHPSIDRLRPFDAETVCHLAQERFDLCLSLDKEPGPAGLAMRVRAAEKRGIGLSAYGTVFPLNPECRPYFRLGLDDDLKFHHNDKSYPQLICEAVGLPYDGQRYRLYPGPAQRRRAAQLWQALGVRPDEVVIGLNTGAGAVFANKTWPPERFIALANALLAHGVGRVALFGGPEEAEQNHWIARACPGVLNTRCDHAELDFVALVERCDVMVTGDTMALHVAVACDVTVVALFGPTCAQEIDLYGRGAKLSAGRACSPCYRRECDRSPSCMDELSVAQVLAAVVRGARPRSAVREPSPVPVGADAGRHI